MKMLTEVCPLCCSPSLAALQPTARAHQNGGITFSGSIASASISGLVVPAAGNNNYQYPAPFAWASRRAAILGLERRPRRPRPAGLPAGATGTGLQQGALAWAPTTSANNSSRNTAMIFPSSTFAWMDWAATRPTPCRSDASNSRWCEVVRKRPCRREARTRFPAADRQFRILRCRPQLRRRTTLRHAAWQLTFVGAVPTRGVFQVDGWGWNRIAFAYSSYTRERGKGHAADTRFFFIEYDDYRHILKTDDRPLATRRRPV